MLRKVLIWIVVALLPLQGYAAAAMISCGPMHARMSLMVASDAAHDGHAAHGHSNEHHAAHGHAGAESGPGEEPAPRDVTNFKCSACASCCTAPAVSTSAVTLVGTLRAHGEAIPFLPTSEDSIVPDGLLRPPRQYLA